jgi:hypothetical protein
MNDQNLIERVAGKLARALTGSAAPENMGAPPAQTAVEGPAQKSVSGFRTEGTWTELEQAAPLSAEAQAELRPKVIPATPPHLLDGVPWPSPAQVRAFDEWLGEQNFAEWVTRQGLDFPAAVAKLQELDAPFSRLSAAIMEASGNQGDKYRAHLSSIATRIASGDASAEKEDSWSLDDWRADALERRSAFKRELGKIETQAWAICEPLLQAKSRFIEEQADFLDFLAGKLFEQFGFKYQSPPYVLGLRKWGLSLRNGSRRNGGLPSRMLENL